MTPDEALRLLQTNPTEALLECAFLISPNEIASIPVFPDMRDVGGPERVQIDFLESAADRKMFKISVGELDTSAILRGTAPASSCYFYPYINNAIPTNLGFCFVPATSPPGTIVLTGGMNGCSLQINKTADERNLIFMHDNNGVAIRDHSTEIINRINTAYRRFPDYNITHRDALDAGNPTVLTNSHICRINYDDYAYLKESAEKYDFYSYEIITRRHLDRWEIYSQCILIKNNMAKKTREYRRATVEKTLSVHCVGII